MKKVDVTSCSHSQGRSISRVMMSRMTVISQLLAASCAMQVSEQPSNSSVVGFTPNKQRWCSAADREMQAGENCDSGIAITSSARKRNDSEIVRLSALAALRLMISSTVTGGHRQAMLGRSAL